MLVLGVAAVGGRAHTVAARLGADLGAVAGVRPPYPLVVVPGVTALDGVTPVTARVVGGPLGLLVAP